MTNDYDAIVVGAGPAGASVATYLARAGYAVLLLDRARFPRDKPCGEFLSPAVWDHLDALGVREAVTAAGARAVPAARIRCADGRSVRGSFAPAAARSGSRYTYGLSVERLVLDGILFENAARCGADAREGVAMRSLLWDRGRVTGVRTDAGDFRAPIVIGCDGVRSRVAREMGGVRPIPRLQKIALVAHYDEVPLEPDHAVEMHVADGGFVCGFGPGPGATADVTVVVASGESGRIAQAGREAYFDAALRRFPEIDRRLTSARRLRLLSCGTYGHTTRRPIADGVLLLGDAATFIDPFTGEGVYFALRGAQLAAETVGTALRRGDTSRRALAPYAAAWRRELRPKYAVCGLVERVVHRERLLAWFVGRFARKPSLLESLLGVTGDMESPWGLLSPTLLLSLPGRSAP